MCVCPCVCVCRPASATRTHGGKYTDRVALQTLLLNIPHLLAFLTHNDQEKQRKKEYTRNKRRKKCETPKTSDDNKRPLLRRAKAPTLARRVFWRCQERPRMRSPGLARRPREGSPRLIRTSYLLDGNKRLTS